MPQKTISITEELDAMIKAKVATGMYNNDSEVVREALRFMHTHEQWIYQVKLEKLREMAAEGRRDIAEGRFSDIGTPEQRSAVFDDIKANALTELKQGGK